MPSCNVFSACYVEMNPCLKIQKKENKPLPEWPEVQSFSGPGHGLMPMSASVSYPLLSFGVKWASLVAQMVKNLPVTQGTQVQSLGWEDPLEKGMAIQSWKISRTEETGGLQSIQLPRVGHD